MTTNRSGINPTEYKVVVLPVEVDDKVGSIIIPQDHQEREQYAQQEGVLVAVSPVAFNYEEFNGAEPKPGDRVLFAKYAGFTRKGKDGVDYRVINDRDICAVLD